MSAPVGAARAARWTTALLLTLCAAVAAAQSPVGAQAATSAASAAAPAALGAFGTSGTTQAGQKGRSVEERLLNELSASAARLGSMEAALSKSADRAESAAWRAFWLALSAIGTTLFGQWWLTRHQRTMSREQAADEVSNAYAEWQLKQLYELYGPLRALLGQSNAMYRQMNEALAKTRPDLFRLLTREGGDFDDKVFELVDQGSWRRFRTVRDLGAVYNKGYGVEPYFDDVVNVGKRMAKLIEEKAGYARPDAKDLIRVMGVYLAHFAVLSRLHKRAQDGLDVAPTPADQEAVFPVEIQKFVDEGYDAINHEVMAWRAQGKKEK